MDDLARQAIFVFRGTVQRLKAATLKHIPVNERTAIVRVDEVLQAPAALRRYKGRRITVQLGGERPIRRGRRAIFFANTWVFGESLAVRSIDHRDSWPPDAGGQARDPVEALARRRLREHLASADLVISGRVASVRIPAGGFGRRPLSEHDPLWRIAGLTIDKIYKGRHDNATVEVRFPLSTDVAWFGAPKLEPGQRGVFLLHKSTEPADEDLGEYVVLHPEDFQLQEQADTIRDSIGDASSGRR